MRALLDRIRHHAVNPNAGQQQRDTREDREQQHVKALASGGFDDHLLHGAHFGDGQLIVQREKFFLEGLH